MARKAGRKARKGLQKGQIGYRLKARGQGQCDTEKQGLKGQGCHFFTTRNWAGCYQSGKSLEINCAQESSCTPTLIGIYIARRYIIIMLLAQLVALPVEQEWGGGEGGLAPPTLAQLIDIMCKVFILCMESCSLVPRRLFQKRAWYCSSFWLRTHLLFNSLSAQLTLNWRSLASYSLASINLCHS